MYFRYDIVPHSLLTHSAVKECLFYLVQKIHTALQEFHGLGFAHYDVRLPNIIDDNYNAVLINLGRCKMCRKNCFLLLLNSCMYNKKLGPQEHDWLQLGWLAHWACSDGEYNNNYHEREFDDLDQKYKDDSFLANLIKTGVGWPS